MGIRASMKQLFEFRAMTRFNKACYILMCTFKGGWGWGNAATLSWHTILPSLKAAWGKLRRDLFTFSTVTKRTVCLFVSARHKIKINFGSVPFKMLIPLSISLTSQLHAEGNLPF